MKQKYYTVVKSSLPIDLSFLSTVLGRIINNNGFQQNFNINNLIYLSIFQ